MNNVNVIFEMNAIPQPSKDLTTAMLLELLKQRYNAQPKTNAGDLKDKFLLTVEEASIYFGIGRNKLRELSDSDDCPFVIWNGGHRKIKRTEFEKFLLEQYSV